MSREFDPTSPTPIITNTPSLATVSPFSNGLQEDPFSSSSSSCQNGKAFELTGSEATSTSMGIGSANSNPWNIQQPQPSLQHEDLALSDTTETILCARLASIDEFFAKNGAHRPPLPCSYCRSLRLQCLILRTTTANPNPIESCSSCVALYRDCSLAERSKRKAQFFETALPVIGHLHGVAEEVGALSEINLSNDTDQQWEPQVAADLAVATAPLRKRNSAQSIKRTGALRVWFAAHSEHPYPIDEEKVALADQSGLTKTQVVNWFINARRRHRSMAHSQLINGSKLFLRGSPTPQSFLAGMSPMERWKNSPPSQEHVSRAVVEEAICASKRGERSSPLPRFHGHSSEGAPSSASGESDLFHSDMLHGSSDSTSSAFSFYHSDDGSQSLASTQSFGHSNQHATSPLKKRHRVTRPGKHMYQCTFCHQSFKKKYDWARHERSIHLPGLACWVCVPPLTENQSCFVWRVGQDHAECIFCGQASPTDEHIQSHEFQICEERPVSDRTFARKDHLWQHLRKVHRCRKWEGWKPHLHVLERQKEDMKSQCGFCMVTMKTWDERVEHLAGHFKQGATMADWTGDSGIKM